MSNEIYSFVKCDCCGYKWVAIRLETLTKLECPKCMTLRYFDEI